ncbi:MAG: Maf family protein [Gammaproteobacteria bacterium]
MIYLASKSPRRRELLDQISIRYEVIDVDIDETWDGKAAAHIHVPMLALRKARAAYDSVSNNPHRPVLAADTEVFLDDKPLGKPDNIDAAVNMLQQLSGRTHQVYSAVALIADQDYTALSISRVSFRPLSIDECRKYVETGESLDKAGGYGIQGHAAGFISELHGSYSGVMGMPLFETTELLRQANLL